MNRVQKIEMIAFMVVMFLLASICALTFAIQPHEGEEDEDAKRRQFLEKVFAREEWEFEYVQVDEHEYLIGKGPYKRGGITHSPKCKCREGRTE